MNNISVVLATYNGDNYIVEQLESLLKQTLPFKELIVCDDNSSDNTKEILAKYASQDSRIKVFCNSQNIGFKANFEKALRLSTGNYVALCDQDDVWHVNHLEVLCKNIGDKMLICGNSDLIDRKGVLLNRRLSQVKNFKKNPEDCNSIFRFVLYYQNPFQGASMLLRRDFLDIALPIPQSVKYHDVWFVHLACIMHTFRYLYEPITLYRMHGNNASGNHSERSALITLFGHLFKRNLVSNRREIIESLIVKQIGNEECIWQLLNEAKRYYLCDRTLLNRIFNFFFELKKYNSIYGRF